MPAISQRDALETLTKARLVKVAQGFEVTTPARASKDDLIGALARSRRASFARILGFLTRAELKEICRQGGMDDSGKQKAAIVERILGSNPSRVKDAGSGYRVPPVQSGLPSVEAVIDPSARKKRARKKKQAPPGDSGPRTPLDQYDHRSATRTNNPPVGLVTPDTDPPAGKKMYRYDPHIDPSLQFDSGGGEGTSAEIDSIIEEGLASNDVESAKKALLALRERRQPYLAWAGKAERTTFEVPSVSLHVHERIDPRTIIEAVRSGDYIQTRSTQKQLGLFEQPSENPPLREAIDFYRHDHNWTNRLIAGDSLLVMNSLLEKEGMEGKVQMVYFDPPYGIKYGSNFQPFVNRRDVSDRRDEDLTQEPESLKAFRDTWELGIHSYLTYLRDRLLLVRGLLAESGSCFVQISDENVHRVRLMMDEVFGPENFCALIVVQKSGGLGASGLKRVADYLLWYARDARAVKYRKMLIPKVVGVGEGTGARYNQLLSPDWETARRLTSEEFDDPSRIPEGWKPFQLDNLTSGAFRENTTVPFEFEGVTYHPGSNACWKTTVEGLDLNLARKKPGVGNSPEEPSVRGV